MWSPETRLSLQELKEVGGERLKLAIASLQKQLETVDSKIADLESQSSQAKRSLAHCQKVGSMQGMQLCLTTSSPKVFKLTFLKDERLRLRNCLEFLTS